ncbi:MAG: hypothetical protein HY368_01800 [Candidatus Aenigmarchaeota archaeon]|nr:hypothetical protein [Candidatus Aenigmarchaeota archaeon]
MEIKFLLILLGMVFAILYIGGAVLGEQCVEIDEYRGCWKTVDTTVTSDLCPTAQPCLATAQAQQHNAISDVLLKACVKASTNGYKDAALNKRIEEVAKSFTGYDITAQQLCGNPGSVLTRQQYG